MPVATQSVVGGAHQARDQPHGDHRSQRAVGPPHRQPCQLRIDRRGGTEGSRAWLPGRVALTCAPSALPDSRTAIGTRSVSRKGPPPMYCERP